MSHTILKLMKREDRILNRRRDREKKFPLGPRAERIGVSLCALRTTDMGPGQCCPGVDLQCYGCNPNLLALGIQCEDQALSKLGTNIVGRDCFCDASCQDFRDCCSDHTETCPELTTLKPTTATTTTTTTTTAMKTREKIIDESWIFDKLFSILLEIINNKFANSDKLKRFLKKYEHLRKFYLNAEHNCRFNKRPYVGEEPDGSSTGFDAIFARLEKHNKLHTSRRLQYLEHGFTKYIKSYYYSAAVNTSTTLLEF